MYRAIVVFFLVTLLAACGSPAQPRCRQFHGESRISGIQSGSTVYLTGGHKAEFVSTETTSQFTVNGLPSMDRIFVAPQDPGVQTHYQGFDVASNNQREYKIEGATVDLVTSEPDYWPMTGEVCTP